MTILDIIANLPSLLRSEVTHLWQEYLTTDSVDEDLILQQPAILTTLPKVWACSPYIANQCLNYPLRFKELLTRHDLLISPANHADILATRLTDISDEAELLRLLRDYRHREMIRIAWRDLAGWADLPETLQSLSNLADNLIETALTWLYQRLITQLGTPCNVEGKPQQLVVLAMGKLGGQELNFSSDIDLIFAYPELGETVGKSRTYSNQEFFVRLGQQLINSLNHITADGLVFRVDMRLRPFGDSGALAMNFSAMEEYYQIHARDWERYAMVKARVAAGDKIAGHTLLTELRPFVYRRYLDYGAFESLRTMKALIDQESVRQGLANNLKLGAGGIREVEFICQVFQLIRGGRQPALQQRHLLTTLTQLEHYNYLPTEVVTQLRAAYYFLRRSENHLQAIEDRQTQTLPSDSLQQARLAYSMGFTNWNDYLEQLQQHQQIVHAQFKEVIAPLTSAKTTTTLINPLKNLWLQGKQADEHTLKWLKSAGFQSVPTLLEQLDQLANSHSVHRLSSRGRERLDTVMPLILEAIIDQHQPDTAAQRVLKLIESIAQRSVYLSLLIERPPVLKQLVKLCAASEWISTQITRYPLLLDELLNPNHLYDPLKPAELDNALHAQLAYLPVDDLELQMDSLRQFKRAYILHIAAAEISGNLAVEVTSDYLAAIADTLVRQTLAMAWDFLTQKYGQPYYRISSTGSDNERQPAGFCIVAYGKAGSAELSYGSDLDIVFLHDSCGIDQVTNGTKPLDNNVFFARLAQRIIHILTTNTPAGTLYEVDPRLRPGGASGLLVSSLDAFKEYQQQDAWTWEHQALIRARAVAGDIDCMIRFEKIRREVLGVPRDPVQLKQDICTMRTKMLENLDKSQHNQFDLKQGRGGLTDIEFIVQYGVLRWAAAYPALLDETAVLPILRRIAEYKLLEESACMQLSQAYRAYRSEIHRLALQNQPAYVNNAEFMEYRQQVTHWWQILL